MLLEKYDPISIFNVPTFNQHFSMIISDEVQLLVTKYSVGFLQFNLHILRFMWTWLSCNRLLLTDCLVNPKKYSDLTSNGPFDLLSLRYVIRECTEPN